MNNLWKIFILFLIGVCFSVKCLQGDLMGATVFYLCAFDVFFIDRIMEMNGQI